MKPRISGWLRIIFVAVFVAASASCPNPLLKEIEEGYFEVDLDGNLTFTNDSMCSHLGYSRKDLMGMNYRGFITEEYIERAYQAFNKVYRTGKSDMGFPWKVIRKDGSIGFVETTISLLRNQKGEVTGFRGVGDTSGQAVGRADVREAVVSRVSCRCG